MQARYWSSWSKKERFAIIVDKSNTVAQLVRANSKVPGSSRGGMTDSLLVSTNTRWLVRVIVS